MNDETVSLFFLLDLLVWEREQTMKEANAFPMDGQWIICVTGRKGDTFDESMIKQFANDGYIWINYARSWRYPTIGITPCGIHEYQHLSRLVDQLLTKEKTNIR